MSDEFLPKGDDDSTVLLKLRRYRDDGVSARDEWKTEREDGAAVWNLEFRGEPDDDSLYYPTVRGLLRHYVRSIRRTYMSAEDIVSVLPEGKKATDFEQTIAEIQAEEINYHLARWNNFLEFVDDTATQCCKIGVCVGKVWWERETDIETFEEEQFSYFDVDPKTGKTVQITPEPIKHEREFISKNKLMVGYVPIDDLLWDPAPRNWDNVKWVIQENIEYTQDELWDKVANDGWSAEAVDAMIFETSPDNTTNEETHHYKTSEFWGEILLPANTEDKRKRTKFVKICADENFKHLLFGPDENVYRYADGPPMIPFEVGYFVRREGEIRGDSYCYTLRDLQGEINCIRNQRRRSVENDLNERYVTDKNAEIEFQQYNGTGHGTVISVNDMQGFKELASRDNTVSSYGELDASDQDLQKQTGVNQYALGMVDPHVTDTLGGIQLMSTASNNIIYDNIISYNQFIENLLTKGLHLSLQYLTVEELASQGVELPEGVERADMMRRMRLRLDTGVGATSEMVKLNNLTRLYFVIRDFVSGYCRDEGIEPGYARYMVAEIVRDMLPLLGQKNKEHFIPSPEELEQFTKDVIDQMAQMQESVQGQQAAQEAEAATQAGLEAGQDLGLQQVEGVAGV